MSRRVTAIASRYSRRSSRRSARRARASTKIVRSRPRWASSHSSSIPGNRSPRYRSMPSRRTSRLAAGSLTADSNWATSTVTASASKRSPCRGQGSDPRWAGRAGSREARGAGSSAPARRPIPATGRTRLRPVRAAGHDSGRDTRGLEGCVDRRHVGRRPITRNWPSRSMWSAPPLPRSPASSDGSGILDSTRPLDHAMPPPTSRVVRATAPRGPSAAAAAPRLPSTRKWRNQSRTWIRFSARRNGVPERVSSWVSSGTRISRTGRFFERRTVNSASAWPTVVRMSFSLCWISSGVRIRVGVGHRRDLAEVRRVVPGRRPELDAPPSRRR